ncbi:arylsulfatase [Paenibacillus sp. 481]|uniref:arylsulfatase n=1 Tax=Paenibacillus sp. 481 TaxID=2835869 RepID=UPI001E5AA2F1|nr:arylsulfatase [Paenibacillus sp. 481]UHA72027.1 arylsulfatase [Paenibacillus sp. 481]
MSESQQSHQKSSSFIKDQQPVIGITVEESIPHWPDPVRAPQGAPNIVLIVIDDLGFSHLGCYGSDIATPNIDSLAQSGLRYNNFHTTAICSPTRASLLTGRNPHATGVAFVSEYDSGFDHSRGKVSKETGLLSELLVEQGYNTFAVGKWHLTPGASQSQAGPFDDWPLGRGFEQYYGFLGGATSQWHPDLVEGNRRVQQPQLPEDGYHLTEDLTERAIAYIREQRTAAPDKPFFCYLAYGATHAPHHAPQAYIDKYKGKYDKGWDETRADWFKRQQRLGIVPTDAKLPPRSPDVKAWASLSMEEKRLFARLQEAFAGFLEHTDVQIGRLFTALQEVEQWDNTVIILLSDNGACAMGGDEGAVANWHNLNGVKESLDSKLARIEEIGTPLANNHYPAGWAQVGNTPLRWYKSFVHAGGVKDPLIIHYPQLIRDGGGIRQQYHHVVDIVPTLLELTGITLPETIRGVRQEPLHGVSLAYTFAQADAPTEKQVQYYEMVGNRGIWHQGWKAVAAHESDTPFQDDKWELYHVDSDFSEVNDLAETHPEKLQELIDLWWIEAGRYGVLPLDGRSLANKLKGLRNARKETVGPVRRTYYPSRVGYARTVAPDIRDKSFQIEAIVERTVIYDGGVIAAFGTRAGGYVLYIQHNRLFFHIHTPGLAQSTFISCEELPLGKIHLRLQVIKSETATGAGFIKGYANDHFIGEGKLLGLTQLGTGAGLLHIGRDSYSSVSALYTPPFAFQGTVHRVDFTVGGHETDWETRMIEELATE